MQQLQMQRHTDRERYHSYVRDRLLMFVDVSVISILRERLLGNLASYQG